MIKTLLASAALVAVLFQTAPAQADQYATWEHSGSLYILTTPEGANLPASASESGFPLLVRLDKDWFDFSQAKPQGDDIRFTTSTGTPLAYEIDQWDPAGGTASIWVRIPSIKGNARQEIRMYWGKADAASESSGPAVFNESNGYLSVWHMNDPVRDAVGTLEAKDTGTTPCPGVIGQSQHFEAGKGINCGEKITTFPTGSSPHSSEAWFKAEKPNAAILAWGNEARQGKVVMDLASPPHIKIGCFFSGADVSGDTTLPLSQWIHVVHTFENGNSRIYVNGRLDGVSTSKGSPLQIKSPARMYLGGWYKNYKFDGDIDEVRISKVMRSADWVRLEYENQKPRQTLTGLLVQPGTDFSVSKQQITVLEGKSAAVSARAGGAQKVYWILKRGGQETIAAVDRFNFTLEAGRVTGDESLTLQFKAVYPQAVKTLDIPVTIKEDIQDPVFTLKAPANWDGRETIEVAPQIANLPEMRAKGAGALLFTWTVANIAVIEEIKPGKLILKRAQNSGIMTVTATISNGGKPITQAIQVAVQEPGKDAWVQRIPGKDEKPVDNQFYARDDQNEGTLFYNGTLDEAADSVFLRVYADDKPYKTETRKLGADKAYAFAVKLKPGLIKYRVEFGAGTGGQEKVLHTASNLVCGDTYIIEGQSNAEATAPGREAVTYTNTWIRTYAHKMGGWCNATRVGQPGWIGYWGMDLATNLWATYKMPICIINGAVGGTRIDEHLPNPTDHYDDSGPHKIYGTLLTRVAAAKLTHGIRALLWHQGEADQGTLGPTGDYDYKSYHQYFVDVSAAWKQDYPNLRYYYLYQIWPNACTDPSANDMLREVQRTLPYLYSNMRVMTTLGIVPGSSCHYVPAGYRRMAALMSPLVQQDNYGLVPRAPITAADLKRAWFTTSKRDEIALEFGQDMAWNNASAGLFYLDYQDTGHPGISGQVASGSVSGRVIKLQLAAPSTNQTITYLVGKAWDKDQANLLYGSNGIAALTFCQVPLSPATPAR